MSTNNSSGENVAGEGASPPPACSPVVLSNLCEALKDNPEFYEAVMKLAEEKGLSWVYTKKTASVSGAAYLQPTMPKAEEDLTHKRPKLDYPSAPPQPQHPYAPPPPNMAPAAYSTSTGAGFHHHQMPPVSMPHYQAPIGGGGGMAPPAGPPMFNDLNDVARNRLSEEERRKDPAFNFYQPGEPSKRLYVKNISRLTTEHDLRSLFRLFAEGEGAKAAAGPTGFSLKYFTVGKMRYQCFVEFENIEQSFSALIHCNGVKVRSRFLLFALLRC